MNWVEKKDAVRCRMAPSRPYLCYCPDWNDIGYQVAYWGNAEKKFYYSDQPNDDFDEYVEKFALFMEAY